MIEFLKKLISWPFRRFNHHDTQDFSTLKRLLNSPEVNPNKRKRAYSERETVKYLVRKVSLLERNLKRMESKTDSLRDRFENYLYVQEKTQNETGINTKENKNEASQ